MLRTPGPVDAVWNRGPTHYWEEAPDFTKKLRN